MTQFNDWKERAGTARDEWATKYWGELEAHIRQELADGEISDATFVAVMNVCMPEGYGDTERFARDTSLRQNELSCWLRGQELPSSDVRAAYIHICLTAAGRTSLADRVVKILTRKEPLPDIFFVSSVSHSQVEEAVSAGSAPVRLVATQQDPRRLEVFATKVTDLYLSTRAENCLKNEFIEYIGQLVNYTEAELLRIPMLGRMSLKEIKETLSSTGVRLGMTPEHCPELGEFFREHPPHRSPEQR